MSLEKEGTGTKIIRRLWDEGWNGGNMEVFRELVHPEFVNHASSYPVPPGPDALRIPAENIRNAFPDLNIRVRRIRELEEEGTTEVFAATVMTGTFNGAGRFMQLNPTGRKFEQQQSHWFKVQNGMVIAHEAIRDDLATLIQLLGVKSLENILRGEYSLEFNPNDPPQDFSQANKGIQDF